MRKCLLILVIPLFLFSDCKKYEKITLTANYLSWGKGYSFLFIANREGDISIKDLSDKDQKSTYYISSSFLCDRFFSCIDELDNIQEVEKEIDDYLNEIKIIYRNKEYMIVFANDEYEAYNVGYNNSNLSSIVKEIITYSLTVIK